MYKTWESGEAWEQEQFEAINMPYKEPNPGEKIVISGISGVYPQCENISVLAQKLFAKEDLITGKF